MPLITKNKPPYYTVENKIKIYTALMVQSGTAAPTATILFNNLGNIVWTRIGVGEYRGTLSNIFLESKTFTIMQQRPDSLIYRENDNSITIITATDDELFGIGIEIRIYP